MKPVSGHTKYIRMRYIQERLDLHKTRILGGFTIASGHMGHKSFTALWWSRLHESKHACCSHEMEVPSEAVSANM